MFSCDRSLSRIASSGRREMERCHLPRHRHGVAENRGSSTWRNGLYSILSSARTDLPKRVTIVSRVTRRSASPGAAIATGASSARLQERTAVAVAEAAPTLRP